MHTPALELELDPAALPPGSRVGSWRVDASRGRGSYGTVYRAVSLERESSGPVALKLALYPADPRFEREAELLLRIRHPSVPRLLGSGLWHSPRGGAHPFVVMEWVEGFPLYTWAAWRNPSSRQVLALLAQAACALQATHAVSAVHRDVKGGNMLVRPSDGRLFLTDFGAGHFSGAPRLTPLHMLPGTPEYRSPELWESGQRAAPGATAPLLARPADDVFALGVTAYRLVTDSYPPLTLPGTQPGQCWQPGGSGAPPPRQLNPRVDAQLNALILRMLSPRPEERGCALELTEAMELGVAHAPRSADESLFEWETLPPSQWTEAEVADAEYLGHRPRRRDRGQVHFAEQADTAARAQLEPREAKAPAPRTVNARHRKARAWMPWLAAAMALGLWPGETDSVRAVEQPTLAHRASDGARRKEDAVSLGGTALSTSEAVAKAPSEGAITMELPKEPLPGQRKPDAKGRCPRTQVPINGGCWGKVDFDLDECRGTLFVYQGGCYAPAFEPVRKPTSAPWQQEP
jgi:hypothetical protein